MDIDDCCGSELKNVQIDELQAYLRGKDLVKKLEVDKADAGVTKVIGYLLAGAGILSLSTFAYYVAKAPDIQAALGDDLRYSVLAVTFGVASYIMFRYSNMAKKRIPELEKDYSVLTSSTRYQEGKRKLEGILPA